METEEKNQPREPNKPANTPLVVLRVKRKRNEEPLEALYVAEHRKAKRAALSHLSECMENVSIGQSRQSSGAISSDAGGNDSDTKTASSLGKLFVRVDTVASSEAHTNSDLVMKRLRANIKQLHSRSAPMSVKKSSQALGSLEQREVSRMRNKSRIQLDRNKKLHKLRNLDRFHFRVVDVKASQAPPFIFNPEKIASSSSSSSASGGTSTGAIGSTHITSPSSNSGTNTNSTGAGVGIGTGASKINRKLRGRSSSNSTSTTSMTPARARSIAKARAERKKRQQAALQKIQSRNDSNIKATDSKSGTSNHQQYNDMLRNYLGSLVPQSGNPTHKKSSDPETQNQETESIEFDDQSEYVYDMYYFLPPDQNESNDMQENLTDVNSQESRLALLSSAGYVSLCFDELKDEYEYYEDESEVDSDDSNRTIDYSDESDDQNCYDLTSDGMSSRMQMPSDVNIDEIAGFGAHPPSLSSHPFQHNYNDSSHSGRIFQDSDGESQDECEWQFTGGNGLLKLTKPRLADSSDDDNHGDSDGQLSGYSDDDYYP